ncbi:MAG: hydrogenase formation protein HypD, partial [Calditrichaeota bacterium]
MKYLDEYRDATAVKLYSRKIKELITRPWTIMEICGGQTHSIMKYGIDDLLPSELTIVHGPGCPVCVTPLEMLDKAIAIAQIPGVIFTSFGDMLRVPGSELDLLSVKAAG